MSIISFRESIRWLPGDASEPTETVVLTGKNTDMFLDVRFFKSSGELDWAFGGYRSHVGSRKTLFIHVIDSRTEDPSMVLDEGFNFPLPNGMTLESGEMVNPATGELTKYEETWRDDASDEYMFIHNRDKTAWYARVGEWYLGLGRDEHGFWAWQACSEEGGSQVKHCTKDGQRNVWRLPVDRRELGDEWVLIESNA